MQDNIQNNIRNNINNNLLTNMGTGTASLGNQLSFQDAVNQVAPRTSNFEGDVSTGAINTNIDDYIRNNQLGSFLGGGENGKFYDQGGSAGTTAQNNSLAQQRAQENAKNYLNNIVDTTGVKNALDIQNQPSFSRFKGLV